METKKIGIACFIGGVVGVIIALLIAPMFWWLGLLSGIAAGFLTGYIAYDIREIIQKIPNAWRAAKNNTRNAFSTTIKSIRFFFRSKLPRIGRWIIKPHPYLHFCFGATALLSASMCIFSSLVINNFFDVIGAMAIIFPMSFIFIYIMTDLLVGFGCSKTFKQKNYLINVIKNEIEFFSDYDSDYDNYHKIAAIPLTYLLIVQSFFKGIGYCLFNIVKFLFWILPKYTGVSIKYMFYGIAMGFYFTGKFAWHLFKLIHSKKRLLCGIDSALGGAISFICLYQNLNIGAAIMIIACGGILGAAIGIANYEFVSKRLLRRYLPNIS